VTETTSPIIAIIVAVAENGVIGANGKMPWHLPSELKYFRARTMGKPVVMGRKTFESIGKPLPGRTTIVVTRQRDFPAQGCLLASNLEEALGLAQQRGETEVFVGGGGEIFALALPLAQQIYLTRVHTRAACQVFCPQVDWGKWGEGERTEHGADEKNEFPFTFSEFKKLKLSL
jgi:dihydrofolate reductase